MISTCGSDGLMTGLMIEREDGWVLADGCRAFLQSFNLTRGIFVISVRNEGIFVKFP